VYHICTDLSKKGWKDKCTPFYNTATYSVSKIVLAFTPSTGKEKDDKGELKILEVVNWPVSAGLMYGPQLNDFFKWAEHLNNNHPEVLGNVSIEVTKSYHLLRYQTKSYDNCRHSLRIFKNDERELLICCGSCPKSPTDKMLISYLQKNV
jgi:hypothetical protein